MGLFSPRKPKKSQNPLSPSHGEIFKKSLTASASAADRLHREEKMRTLSASVDKATNILTRSKHFRKMATKIFNDLDIDRSNTLDNEELYAGVILVHLQLAKYTGAAACNPPSRLVVKTIFNEFDSDDSNSLDVEEFINVCILLSGQVLGRVGFQWIFTLVISPFLGQYLLNLVIFILAKSKCGFTSKILAFPFAQTVWSRIPSTIPVTVMSCVVACLLVPLILDCIDTKFRSFAHDRHNASSFLNDKPKTK